MGGSGLGLNLPGVEKAMIEMEGSGLTGEDLKEKFARLGRRVCSAYTLIKPVRRGGCERWADDDPGGDKSWTTLTYGHSGSGNTISTSRT